MASQTDVSARIHWELHDISAEARFLPERAAAWETEPDENRAAFMLEWSNLMGGLTFLQRAQRSGSMTADQERRYHQLLREMRQALPLIRKLGLYDPLVSLRPD